MPVAAWNGYRGFMDGTIFHQGLCPVEENGTVCILNFVGYSSNNQLVLVRIFVLKSPKKLKTLFNIVEAPFKKLLIFDVCVVWWCSDGPINSQEYKSFEIYAVSIKISMTEYHHWINGLADHLYSNTAVDLWGEMSTVFLVTIFPLFEALNGAFDEVQFFQGFIFTPYQRHW